MKLALVNLDRSVHDAVGYGGPRLAVECSPCSGVRAAMLGWMMARAALGMGRYLWLSANPEEDVARVKRMLPAARWDSATRAYTWVNSALAFEAQDQRVTDAVVMDAHEVDDPQVMLAQHARGLVRFVGAVGPLGSWFRRLVDSGTVPVLRSYPQVAALERLRTVVQPELFRREYLGERETELRGVAKRFNTFSRTQLNIRDKAGTVVPFRLNSVQRTYAAIKAVKAAELRKKGLSAKFLLLKYRRGGFTTFEQGQSYQMCSTRANMQAATLAHTKEATAQIFRIATLYHRLDPQGPKLKGVGNAQRLDFPDLNSTFFIGTAGAGGFSRGDTLQRCHGSEVSKWGKGARRREFVRDLVAGVTEATSHGEVVLETTPNGIEWFAETYREAKANQNDWVPIFIPWYWDPTNRMPDSTFVAEEIAATLSDREKALVEQHRLRPAQIAWRRMKVKALGPLFVQEYPEDDVSCFLTTGACYFDVGRVLSLLESVPEYSVKPMGGYGYEVRWVQPEAGVEYVAGCDTSEGVPGKESNDWMSGVGGSDPNGVGVFRWDTGEQVAAVHGIFDPLELAQHARNLAHAYNDALLGVERNNHGHAVIAHLLGDDLYYHNLFIADDGRAGWVTSPRTRPVMLSELREAIDEGYMTVRDRHMLQECLLFTKQSTGKFEGKPDDCVMKWAIAWQMRKQGSSTRLITIESEE